MTDAPHILTIDLAALADNYTLLAKLGNAPHTGACIKANAYGTGADMAATALAARGCRDFFVATAAEGARLRPHVTGDIYVFAGLHSGSTAEFTAHGLIPSLNSLADISAHKAVGGGACAVFFDTGLNRLGLGADETAHLLQHPELLSGLDIRLFLSHFACAEDPAHPLNAQQCARAHNIRAALSPLYPAARWSMCNSSGIFHYPEVRYDLLRPGYALYGGNPTPEKPNPMKPVVRLDVRVLQTRYVRAGDTIGYSATHRFDADSETATVCLGYADGFARAHQKGGAVLYWQGQPCPVIGRVSMDLVTIGIGHLEGPRPQAGDMLEVLGPHQDADMLAASAGTIGYEILTSLGLRYARRYIGAP